MSENKKQLSFRISDELYNRFKEKLAQENMKSSKFFREQIQQYVLNETERNLIRESIATAESRNRLSMEISRIGNNLNQISRAYNILKNKNVVSEEEVTIVKNQLMDTINFLHKCRDDLNA